MQKGATVLSCAHAIFPTLLPDGLFLPYAIVMRDVKYWSTNFKQNLKVNLHELKSWTGVLTLALQADGILHAFTNVHKKYPLTQYIYPSLSGLCKTTALIKAYNAWNDAAKLSHYYSFIVDSSVGAAFGLYELCTSRITLPDDVSQQSWTDKLQLKIQQKLSLPVGDASENKYYYGAKDLTKLIALCLVPTNPVSIGARAYQGMMMAYNYYTSGYVEQTLVAMIANAAYYAKQKDHNKTKEILAKMESTIKEVNGSLNYKVSNSKIIKQACIYLFDSESAEMFRNGQYAELRKYSEFQFQLERQILIFSSTLFPVDLHLNLVFLRLYSHACDKNYFIENAKKIYQELNELYAYVMESRAYSDDEKLKLRENFNATAEFYYNTHVTFIRDTLFEDYISFLNSHESHSKLEDCRRLVASLVNSDVNFINDYTKKLSAESIHFLGVAYYLMWDHLGYIQFFDKIHPEQKHYLYWFTLAKTIEKFVSSISDDEKKHHLNKMIRHCYNQVNILIDKTVRDENADSLQKIITQWRGRHAPLESQGDLAYDSKWIQYLEDIVEENQNSAITSLPHVATVESHALSESQLENKFDNKVTNKSFTLFNKEKPRLSEDKLSQVQLYLDQGQDKYHLADYSGAMKYFVEVLRIDEGNEEARYRKAICHYFLDQYQEAVDNYEKVYLVNPNQDHWFFLMRGYAHSLNGSIELAKADHDKAERLRSQSRKGLS